MALTGSGAAAADPERHVRGDVHARDERGVDRQGRAEAGTGIAARTGIKGLRQFLRGLDGPFGIGMEEVFGKLNLSPGGGFLHQNILVNGTG